MEEQFYKPLWVKAVLGFGLVFAGILFTFMMYKFFPVPNQARFDGFGALTYVGIGLACTLIIYILGVLYSRNHPYRVFSLCLMFFIGFLVIVRSLVIGY